jgi:hypothetical protein
MASNLMCGIGFGASRRSGLFAIGARSLSCTARMASSRRSHSGAARAWPSFLFLVLGALRCTDWLADVVARDRNGLILTGTNAGGESLLETSIRGVFAAGDVR